MASRRGWIRLNLTAFLFANSLESDLFGAIATVMSGMIALGFGFLFVQRMNEDDGIYEDAPQWALHLLKQEALKCNLPVEETQEEEQPTQEEPAMDLDEEEEMEVELMMNWKRNCWNLTRKRPLKQNPSLRLRKRSDSMMNWKRNCWNLTRKRPLKQNPSLRLRKKSPSLLLSLPQACNLLDTGEGFSLRLPKDAVDNIIASLDATPHDGFVPVVAFGPSGQIMLTFESSDKSA